jgi:hypothetical protein
VIGSAIVDRVRAAGVIVTLRADGGIGLRPAARVSPHLVNEIRAHRQEVVDELRRRSTMLEWATRGMLCSSCRKVDITLQLPDDRRLCASCIEWRVAGCPYFTVLVGVDDVAQAEHGACIACGGSWPLHGSPEYTSWRRVTDADDVELLGTRFVIASAQKLARGPR